MATSDLATILQRLKAEIVRSVNKALREIRAREASPNGGKQIPAGMTREDFDKIRDSLGRVQEATMAKIVNMRLNESNAEEAAPVFVGWVESDDIQELRRQRNERDPRIYRLRDTIPSKEYEDTLDATVTAKTVAVVPRDWRIQLDEKSPQQKAQVPRAGVMIQRLIGIVVQDGNVRRCVGALNFGFKVDPKVPIPGDEQLKGLAANLAQELKTFNFKFGGPIF